MVISYPITSRSKKRGKLGPADCQQAKTMKNIAAEVKAYLRRFFITYPNDSFRYRRL